MVLCCSGELIVFWCCTGGQLLSGLGWKSHGLWISALVSPWGVFLWGFSLKTVTVGVSINVIHNQCLVCGVSAPTAV